jgi:glucokinase
MSLKLGIDVGGTKVLGGVVDHEGKVLARSRKETPREGGLALVKVIAEVARELIAEHQVSSVGVCAAGFISSDRQTVTATPNIVGWNGINLASELEKLLDNRVVVENDAKAAAWGEKRFGSGRPYQTLFMLTIGTGLGGGFINNGELFRGAHGMATEFGHMRAVPNGHLCGCGARGCYEQYAAGSALLRHAREAISASPELARNLLARGNGTIDGVTGQHVTDAARDGDSVAIAAFATTAEWIGSAAANLVAALDPEAIIIGGGVIDAGEILLGPVRDSLKRHLPFSGKYPIPPIVAATMGNDAGLVGAADLSAI